VGPDRRLVVSGVFIDDLPACCPIFGAGDMLDGVYTGKRVLIKGSTGSRCPAEDDLSVTIHGETLTFTDSILQKFIIGFSPDQSGSFSQMTIEGDTMVNIQGRVNGDVLDADVINSTNGCEHHWHLTKKH